MKLARGGDAVAPTHRFIIYQYGKVGSTSLAAALNRKRGVKAYQCHFLGEAAFNGTIKRLIKPETSDYFFEHSSGQLMDNLRAYRFFQRREIDSDPVTVLTLARDPFDWFRSAMSQDIVEHSRVLRRMLSVRDSAPSNDGEAVEQGLQLVMQYLLWMIEHFGSLDAMCDGLRFPALRKNMDYVDREDFDALMFFLNTFMRPHLWFGSHFEPAIGIGLSDLKPLGCGVDSYRASWGGVYLLRFEQLRQGFPAVLGDLGMSRRLRLGRSNQRVKKPFARELERAFASADARRLAAVCHSPLTRSLGYAPPAGEHSASL